MQIRHANLADLGAIIELGNSSPNAAHWTEPQYRELVQSGSVPERLILVAEWQLAAEHGHAVGFLVARYIAKEWELENIVVEPESRGKGIGKRLLAALFSHVQQTGGGAVFLEVRESNLAARNLYEALEFRKTGRRKAYYSDPEEDAVLYTWNPS